MPALEAKVSLETESKKDRKLDDSGFTVQDLAKQLESGEGYTLVCEADPDTEGEYPVEVVLNEEIRKKLEKDWVSISGEESGGRLGRHQVQKVRRQLCDQ